MESIATDNPHCDYSAGLTLRAFRGGKRGKLIADNVGTIVFVDHRLCEITGYSEEELIGSNPRMLQSGNTSRETYLAMWHSISCGKSWQGTLQNRKKSGELFWETISIAPIKDCRGGVTHFLAIIEERGELPTDRMNSRKTIGEANEWNLHP